MSSHPPLRRVETPAFERNNNVLRDLHHLIRTSMKDFWSMVEIAPKAIKSYIPHSFVGKGKVYRLTVGEPHSDKPAIYFDHGFGANKNTQPILFYLAVMGYEIFIHVKPFMMDIRQQADLSAEQLQKIGRSLDDIVLLGHSMGGLTQEQMVKKLGVAPQKYISLATPHLGTPLAKIGPGKSARQMEPCSDFCMDLYSIPFPKNVEPYSFVTTYDNVVPAESAFVNSHALNVLFGRANHISIIEDPRIALWINHVIEENHRHFEPYMERRQFTPSLHRRLQESIRPQQLNKISGIRKLYETFDKHNSFKIVSSSRYEKAAKKREEFSRLQKQAYG